MCINFNGDLRKDQHFSYVYSPHRTPVDGLNNSYGKKVSIVKHKLSVPTSIAVQKNVAFHYI